MSWKSTVAALGIAFALVLAVTLGASADPIKVGIMGPFSGPFAIAGKNFKLGIDAYRALNGEKAGGRFDVEFIYRDIGEPDPAKAKALAQELIVKEKVDYLGGIYFTPNAMAVAPLLEESKTPLVVFNAATSAITQRSPQHHPHVVHDVAEHRANSQYRCRHGAEEGGDDRDRLRPRHRR